MGTRGSNLKSKDLLIARCLLLAAAAACYQDSRPGPSWVLVLVNALEITVEQSPLALQMFLHGQDDPPETCVQNGLFSPQNRPPRGTMAWHTPSSPPICVPSMAHSLCKNNGNYEDSEVSLKRGKLR